MLGIVLFGIYILEVINVMYFPISLSDTWPADLTQETVLYTLKNVNLSPLYFLSFIYRPFSMKWLFVDFVLNILLTIPFGIGLGYFRRPRFLKMCLWAVSTGFTLEGIQLLLKLIINNYHVIDINDVIMNAFGVVLGYCIFLLFSRPGKHADV
jgi:glycopeptide antibiotics resistance protein